ncbi:succinate dehydrogenase, cytochrome b556 subunit [Saccharospirillum alexandrii]|uniref:succinate dehydrogenase, cytochrome b556 subunit n=1 Tax=Saccharospirillum alexandrii TaxID=2448477 RepID=UPI000FD81901|nr:succinate dehydrogenase, cytochrome b556 subunit [Saccharospirillum alexandrii]
MKDHRPKNLDLATIRQPITAIASILHRITGVMLFVAVGFLVWALSLSLESRQGFDQTVAVMTHPLAKLITWGILSLVIYHLFAGIKHLIMDAGFAETKEGGPLAAKITLVLTVVVIVLMGIWVW